MIVSSAFFGMISLVALAALALVYQFYPERNGPGYRPPPPPPAPPPASPFVPTTKKRKSGAQRNRLEEDPQSIAFQDTDAELLLQPTTMENRDVPVDEPAAPPIFSPQENNIGQRTELEEDPAFQDTDDELTLQPTTMENRSQRDEGLRRRPGGRMIAAISAIAVVVFGIWYLRSTSYTSVNFAALEEDYSTNVFGQHLVAPVILKAVPDFWNNTNPKKPLVLSFHGWTGGGKNLVSQILVRNLYPAEDKRNKCVQLFDVTHHFSPEENIAKDTIKKRIHGTVTKCERAVFIFDEMDKMPPGLIDVIKPYLDTYEQLDGLSFRKCIFIFLSNAGGEKITEFALEFWRNKHKREDIKLSDVESHLSKLAFNKKGGFWHSSLIDRNLIDVFVPFLPLEEEHVRMCVRAELRHRDRTINEELVTKIAGEMSYYPERERVYSVKGCKTVATKISLFL